MTQGKNSAILAHAREVLEQEAQAILDLREHLGPEFEKAVRALLELPSTNRVIVSGIGKTSFISMKISATLASVGVPSFFLHPAEAVHGDLGRYTRGDVALILSNSGETSEILRIIPHIKRFGCTIISICASNDSSLAAHSDIILAIGKLPEAGPLGLAPTTSTSVMLALGDALAMSVFSQRAYSKEDFARYHPAGALGASLMSVVEVMRSGEQHCVVLEDLNGRDVLHQITITKGRPGAASIVNAQGFLVGVFTDGNLRRCLDQGDDFLKQPIKQVMTANPKTVSHDKLAAEALRLMSQYKIDQLVVVDPANRPVGMVDIQDLLDIGLR